MARDRAAKGPRKADDELVPIKIKRSTYRLVKVAAALMDLTAAEYLDRAVRERVPCDLGAYKGELADLFAQALGPEEQGRKK